MFPDPAVLEASALARFIATTALVYPVLSALHILGLGLLVGAIALVDLRLVGALGPALDPARRVLRRAAVTGLGLAVITGGLLALVDLSTYLGNPAFLLKLGLMAVALLNAALYEITGRAPRLAGALSLTLWVAVLFCGRFIAFTD